jgi:hypothetical protein
MDVEANNVQIRALTNALGIPLRVEIVCPGSDLGMMQVKCQDFFPQTESAAGSTWGPEHSGKSSSPSRMAEHLDQQRDNNSVEETSTGTSGSLLSSDGIPLVTLLCTLCDYDILYRKQT